MEMKEFRKNFAHQKAFGNHRNEFTTPLAAPGASEILRVTRQGSQDASRC